MRFCVHKQTLSSHTSRPVLCDKKLDLWKLVLKTHLPSLKKSSFSCSRVTWNWSACRALEGDAHAEWLLSFETFNKRGVLIWDNLTLLKDSDRNDARNTVSSRCLEAFGGKIIHDWKKTSWWAVELALEHYRERYFARQERCNIWQKRGRILKGAKPRPHFTEASAVTAGT